MTGSEYRHHFKGRNFMTPVVIEYGKIGDRYYELSRSQKTSPLVNDAVKKAGFAENLYGVTVSAGEGSAVFHSEKDARDHIEALSEVQHEKY